MPRSGERGGPQTRARILEVANRLFLERGFDAVTVAEVAREAGVSSVTVFNHFATKEDLFLDRAADAEELLTRAVRERAPGTEVLASLRTAALRLLDERSAFAGVDERSVGFLRTVAGSPALVARARAIAAHLQRLLADELEADTAFRGDAALLAAFFIAGYGTALSETAGQRLAGVPSEEAAVDHRARLDRLFDALRDGVG